MHTSVRAVLVASFAVLASLLVTPSAHAAAPDLGPVLAPLPSSSSGGGTGSPELDALVVTACNAGTALAEPAWFQLPAGSSGSVFARARRQIITTARTSDVFASTALAFVDVTTSTVLGCGEAPVTVAPGQTTAVVVWFSATELAQWKDGCTSTCPIAPEVFVDHAAPVPANDDLANAAAVGTVPFSITGNSARATDDGPEAFSSCWSIGTSLTTPTSTVWWSWTAPEDGYLTAAATGTGWSPCTAVRDTDPAFTVPSDWYTDAGSARTDIPVLAGHSYLVSVSCNYDPIFDIRPLRTGGPFNLDLTFAAGPGPVTTTSVSEGTDSVTLGWEPPVSSPGSLPVTGYDVSFAGADPGAVPTVRLLGADARTATFTGLALGYYVATVTARTAAGPGGAVRQFVALVSAPGPVTLSAVSNAPAEVTASWFEPLPAPYTERPDSYRVSLVDTDPGSVPVVRTVLPSQPLTTTFAGLVSGHAYDVTVVPVSNRGDGTPVTRRVSLTAAGFAGPLASAPLTTRARRGNRLVTATWSASAYTGTSAITGYRVRVFSGLTRVLVRSLVVGATRRSASVGGLVNGRVYSVDVAALNSSGAGTVSRRSSLLVPATTAGSPVIGRARPGAVGGTSTATATWGAPRSTGGIALRGYVVTAWRYDRAGRLLSSQVSALRSARTRAYTFVLPRGYYRFSVRAVNAVGVGTSSRRSATVVAR